MLLLLDNYDSFTYNLADYFQQLGQQVTVVKNDACTLSALTALKPDILVISPGPGHPAQADLSLAALDYFAGHIPILGICLGHQVIGHYFNARIVSAPQPMHGKISPITHDNQTMFVGLPQPLSVVRYHSLMIEPASLPAILQVTASTADGLIMGVRHTALPIEGVQFHPEAILTESGLALLKHFIDYYRPGEIP